MKKVLITICLLLLVLPLIQARGEVTEINFVEQNPVLVAVGLKDRVDFEVEGKPRVLIVDVIRESGRVEMEIFADKENATRTNLKPGDGKRIELDFDRDRETDTIIRLVDFADENTPVLSIENTHLERKTKTIPTRLPNEKGFNTKPLKGVIIALIIIIAGLLFYTYTRED